MLANTWLQTVKRQRRQEKTGGKKEKGKGEAEIEKEQRGTEAEHEKQQGVRWQGKLSERKMGSRGI